MNDASSTRRAQPDPDDLVGPDQGWIRGQMAIFLIAIIVPPVERLLIGAGYEIIHPIVTIIAGLVLVIAMFQILNRSRQDLAENLRVSPTPKPDGRLIDQGIYSRVRHPMYLAAVLGVLGWAVIWQSWAGLLMTVVTYVFFTAKARYEERMLMRQYPGYADYRQRVPGRFVPLPRRG